MIHMITGGSGSGKSAYAEEQILSLGRRPRIYIATMFSDDPESERKVERHRMMRSKKDFTTIEQYHDIQRTSVPPGAAVLLECLSNLMANEMYRKEPQEADCAQHILEGLSRLSRQAGALVVVTNEVFSDGSLYHPETERYRCNLGMANTELAKMADRVTEVVYGIPVVLKGSGL